MHTEHNPSYDGEHSHDRQYPVQHRLFSPTDLEVTGPLSFKRRAALALEQLEMDVVDRTFLTGTLYVDGYDVHLAATAWATDHADHKRLEEILARKLMEA